MKSFCTIRLDAGHDSCGNPRRVFVTFDGTGDIVGVYDEGYNGANAITNHEHREAWNGLTFMTVLEEYNMLLNKGDE